jgi:hypothetical protein
MVEAFGGSLFHDILLATSKKSDSINDEECAVISNGKLANSVYAANNLFALNQYRHEKIQAWIFNGQSRGTVGAMPLLLTNLII